MVYGVYSRGRQTVFPHVISAKAEIQALFEAVSPDLPQASAGGDEIKTWVKLSTGVETSAYPNKRSRLKANEAIPSEWIRSMNTSSSDPADWYIMEFDGQDLFFGYANLGESDMAEWGYISFQEIRELKVVPGLEMDRDLHWTPEEGLRKSKISGFEPAWYRSP